MVTDNVDDSIVDQLESLYAEKDRLNEELGVSDPEEIIEMVRSLQDQVESLYEEKDQN